MVDVAVEAAELRTGGDVHGRVAVRAGGAGANAAVWAASRGASVLVHGRVGGDTSGAIVVAALEDRGVTAAVARDPAAPTGAVLVVLERGERSMVADRGANARLSPQDLPDQIEAGAVLVSGYLLFDEGSEPAAIESLARARTDLLAVDAASWPLLEAFGPSRFVERTSAAGLVLANEREAEVLTGATGEEAARKLAASYRYACVKLGGGGAVLAEGDRVTRAPVERVDAPDPTGAGDALAGVLLAEVARGAPIETALRRGAEAAAASVAADTGWPPR